MMHLIDWAQVDLKKATKSNTFDMAAVDWTVKKLQNYKAIDWANVSNHQIT